MTSISRRIKINVSSENAIAAFLGKINSWWPKDYTWSKEALVEIKIDGHKCGLCTEIGPYGFRCDWGRITELTENKIGLNGRSV